MKVQNKTAPIRFIKGNRGELYLDSLMSIFVLFLCVSIALAILPVVIQKQQLEVLAKEVARYVEVTGSVSYYEYEADRCADRIGVSYDHCSVEDATYFSGDKIQLRDEFTIVLEKTTYVEFGGMVRFPVDLTARATGRSEVYWK